MYKLSVGPTAYVITDEQVTKLVHVPGIGITHRPVTDQAEATALRAQAAEEVARRDALRAEAATGRHAYVRFGTVPATGRSHNGMDSHDEAGVSVYAAWITPSCVYIDCTQTYSTYAVFGVQRPLYEVTGTELGNRGGDDEPLLSDAQVVATLGQDWVIVK